MSTAQQKEAVRNQVVMSAVTLQRNIPGLLHFVRVSVPQSVVKGGYAAMWIVSTLRTSLVSGVYT